MKDSYPKKHGTRFRPGVVLTVLGLTAAAALAAGLAAPVATGEGYTQADVAQLVAYVLLALVFSFLCSVAEAVLLSITPSFMAGLAEQKPKLGALVKRLKQEKVDRSLAAILTLNTIAHTVGAIGSGAKATLVFGSEFFGIFSAVMTLMILFLSEIIPKTLGAVYWRKLAGVTAYFVQGLIYLMFPLILASELLTKLITRGRRVHAFSRDEFLAMAVVGEESGHLNEDESRIIHNLLRLGALKAHDIMTPRTVVMSLDEERTVASVLQEHADTPFSRIPVYAGDLDHVTGFILRDDLLLCQAREEGDHLLKSLRRDMHRVPESLPLVELLDFFLNQRTHMVIVLDEYGGTAGLVTLEDLVETLLGMEIVDEADRVVDMQALARQQWAKRAKALGLQVDVPSAE